MNLSDILQRSAFPQPWSEGEKIPWDEPAFSGRMLEEHLSQAHDAASRRLEIIAEHVDWIHHSLLSGRPSRILDLGCGPGLYSNRLAMLGHTCTGIDFSPASLDYARRTAAPGCEYRQADLRTADFGAGYNLVMLIFGEFNTFRPQDARRIMQKAWGALLPGGRLLLEVSDYASVQRTGSRPSSWFGGGRGLFSATPYLCLNENFWDEASGLATERYYVIDAATAAVTPMVQCTQAYRPQQLLDLLGECGYAEIETYPSLTGLEDARQPDLVALVARRPV